MELLRDDLGFVERRRLLVLEQVWHDGGPPLTKPLTRGYAAAVVTNPFAGRHVPDIVDAMVALRPLGLSLAAELAQALGGPSEITGYGKGAIVGEAGELEHGALWHAAGGHAMRESLASALAIVPSTKKVAAPGATLDIPLTHKDASYVRSHFDAIEVRVPGAPESDEIVFVLAMSTGPRVHARLGGLGVDDISAWDGLR